MPLGRAGQPCTRVMADPNSRATTITDRRGLIVKEAASHLSSLAPFLSVDNPVSSALTRELLGWQPTCSEFIDDLDQGHYFNNRRVMARRSEPG